jgi:formylglycine-generating enzyme required for sulfatase activity
MNLVKKLLIGTTCLSTVAYVGYKIDQEQRGKQPERTVQEKKADWKNFLGLTKKREVINLGDGVKIEFVYIPGGKYYRREYAESDQEYYKRVNAAGDYLPRKYRNIEDGRVEPFYISKTEVTYAQFKKFNPKWVTVAIAKERKGDGPNCPIEGPSYNNAEEFCDFLSAKSRKKVKIPTERQWSYVYMGGNFNRRYCTGEEIDRRYGNLASPDPIEYLKRNHVKEAGSFLPNEFGVYDMMGSLREYIREMENTKLPGMMGEFYNLRGPDLLDWRIEVPPERQESFRRIIEESKGIRLVIEP